MLLFWQIWRGLYATTARPQFARFRSSIGRSSAATPDSSRDLDCDIGLKSSFFDELQIV